MNHNLNDYVIYRYADGYCSWTHRPNLEGKHYAYQNLEVIATGLTRDQAMDMCELANADTEGTKAWMTDEEFSDWAKGKV